MGSGDAKQVVGAGSGSTIIKIADGAATNFLKVNDGARFWSIRGFKFTGPTVTTPTSGEVIYVDNNTSSDANISDVVMRGGKFWVGLHLREVNQVYIDKLEIYEAQSYHILMQGALNVFINQLLINGVDKTGTGVSIIASATYGNSEAVLISNSIIANTAEALQITGTTLSPTTAGRNLEHKFVNVYFDDSTLEGADITYAVSCQFTNCYFASNGNFGCHLRFTEYMQFVNCTFTKNENDGLYIESDSKYTTVLGGSASDNDDLGTGAFAGIDVEGGGGFFTIIGVQCNATTNLYNKNQDYGIIIGNSCNNYIVKDCTFDGNVTAAVLNNSGYNGSTKLFKDNLGWVTDNYGSASVTPDGSGNGTIAHGLDVNPTYVEVSIVGDHGLHADVQSSSSTNITVRVKDSAGADVTSGTYVIKWAAKA